MDDNLASNSSTNLGQLDEVTRVLDEIQIARNIIKQCKDVNATPDFEYYTRIQTTKEINELFKKNSKTFSDWLNENSKQQEQRIRVPYEDLRKAIYRNYIEKLRIPLRAKLLVNLRNKHKKITRKTLDSDLKHHGFFWKQLGNTKKYALIEKPDQAAKRMRYLYEMKQIRNDKKAIVYVEVHTAKIKANSGDLIEIDIAVAVSPQIGLIDVLVKNTNDSSITIDSWLNNKLRGLPEDTVFVIEPFPKVLKELNVPGKHSKKSDMIEWLNKNNVPFFATSHRGELIVLIEMYKGRHQAKIETFKLLMAKNYKVIFRPRELNYMKYLKFLYGRLNSVLDGADLSKLKVDYLKVLNDVDHEEWSKNDNEIAIFETKMLEEEEKLELVIDRLMESVQNKSLELSDLEDCEEDCVDEDYIDSILIK